MIDRLLEVQRAGGRAVVLTVIEGDGVGSKLLVVEGGETVGDGPPELAEHADELIRGGRNRTLELEGRKVFGEVYGAAAASVRLRGRRHRRGAVRRREAARLGGRSSPTGVQVRDARADAER